MSEKKKDRLVKLVKHEYIPKELRTATITRPQEQLHLKYKEIPLAESYAEFVNYSIRDEESNE